jgi:hypothetical protein
MFRKDESQRDRGSGRHQKDPQVPGIMAGQAFAPETVPQMQIPALSMGPPDYCDIVIRRVDHAV